MIIEWDFSVTGKGWIQKKMLWEHRLNRVSPIGIFYPSHPVISTTFGLPVGVGLLKLPLVTGEIYAEVP